MTRIAPRSLNSKDDASMGALTLRFEDKNHFSSTCASGGKSDEAHEPIAMRYTRVR